MGRLRLFIAVDTPAAVKRELTLLRDDLAHGTRGVAWEDPRKFHCTLLFLGNVDEDRLAYVVQEVSREAEKSPPLLLGFSGIGFFPDSARPRVVWAGIQDPTGGLGRLQERLADDLHGPEFLSEEKPFHPHVTLGRIGKGRRPGGLIDIAETLTLNHPQVIVPAVEIMQSVLSPRGSEYVVLRSIPFTGRADDRSGVSPGDPA